MRVVEVSGNAKELVVVRTSACGMRVVEVFRRGSKRAAVKTDTGIRVRVPLELAVIGAELDEKRIGTAPNV